MKTVKLLKETYNMKNREKTYNMKNREKSNEPNNQLERNKCYTTEEKKSLKIP
jgi:hypothetical protein